MSTGITRLAEVGSTNDWLLERAAALEDGHWVIAERQTAGRGRRGRVWSDGAGNLMSSVLVKPQAGETEVQQLSFVAALALHDALAAAAAPERLKLKWPNDILLDGCKVSGILLDRAGEPLVIGFGVNIASCPGDTGRPAIALADVAGLPPSAETLLGGLIAAFAARRTEWREQSFAVTRDHWLARASGLGDRIAARLGAEILTGRFEGLEADGALALRLDNGALRPVHAGEIFALGGS